MSRNKFTLLIGLVMVLAIALSACGGTTAEAPAAGESETITVAYSAPNAGWPYIAAFINALEEKGAATDGVEVVVLSGEGDIAKQAADFDTLIAQDVDVILVCSLDGNAIVPSIQAAVDAGIPVLAVSNEPADEGKELIEGYSGPDDYVQGRIAAELMHEALGGEGNIVIIEGTPGQSTTDLRNNGFFDQMEEQGSNFTILAQQTANWDPVQAKAVMEDFITAYGDEINGVFSQDDNTAAAAAEVLRDAGMIPGVAVVGTGGSKNGIQAIKDGLLYGTMDQSPTTDAHQALDFAIMLHNGEALPEKRNIIPMPKITSENVDQFEGEW